MEFDAFSLLGATISLECAILSLGAALFLDYRREERRRRFRGHLERTLQDNRPRVLVNVADAA